MISNNDKDGDGGPGDDDVSRQGSGCISNFSFGWWSGELSPRKACWSHPHTWLTSLSAPSMTQAWTAPACVQSRLPGQLRPTGPALRDSASPPWSSQRLSTIISNRSASTLVQDRINNINQHQTAKAASSQTNTKTNDQQQHQRQHKQVSLRSSSW